MKKYKTLIIITVVAVAAIIGFAYKDKIKALFSGKKKLTDAEIEAKAKELCKDTPPQGMGQCVYNTIRTLKVERDKI